MGYVLSVDISRCLGCKRCTIECAVAHSKTKDLAQAINEDPAPISRVSLTCIDGQAVALQCRHCEDAPCIAVCPSGALNRLEDDGPVLVRQELCIGCHACILACPFGVIFSDREGKAVVKCDLCIERRAAGEEPACVAACHTGALRLVREEEVQRKKRERAARDLLNSQSS